MGGHRVGRFHLEYAALNQIRNIGVEQQRPLVSAYAFRQRELHHILVDVQDQQQRGVVAELLYAASLRAAVHQHADAAHVGIGPLRALHLAAVGVDPGDVLDLEFFVVLAGEEAAAAQHRIFVAERNQPLHESNLRLVLLRKIPIEPADFVVLAVGVVVSALGARKFIAGHNHRRALGEEQSPEHAAHLPLAERVDRRVIGGAFGAAIPGAIVGAAIAIILAVRFVVFFVVADHVVPSETVVRGDEIHAGPGLAALAVEEIAGSAKPGSDDGRGGLAAPEIADVIAKLIVPFGPAGRERADLIAAGAAIPRFGN